MAEDCNEVFERIRDFSDVFDGEGNSELEAELYAQSTTRAPDLRPQPHPGTASPNPEGTLPPASSTSNTSLRGPKMGMTNSAAGYGELTKFFHWAIVVLFTLQFFSGHIMTAIGFNSSFAGIDTNTHYNWHKSLGLLALVVAIGRLINRQLGELPPERPRSALANAASCTGPSKRFT